MGFEPICLAIDQGGLEPLHNYRTLPFQFTYTYKNWKLSTLPIDRGLPTRMHTSQFQFRYRNCSLNEPRWTLAFNL